jgi:hypothetical protein
MPNKKPRYKTLAALEELHRDMIEQARLLNVEISEARVHLLALERRQRDDRDALAAVQRELAQARQRSKFPPEVQDDLVRINRGYPRYIRPIKVTKKMVKYEDWDSWKKEMRNRQCSHDEFVAMTDNRTWPLWLARELGFK